MERKGKEVVGKVEIDVLVEDKIRVERLTTIEEGIEEEEEVEKERGEVRGIGKKQGHDHIEQLQCTNASFLEKGATSVTKVKGRVEMLKGVTDEEIVFFCSASGKMITLLSSERKHFKMPEAAARLSSVLADMIDDKGFTNDDIPLPHHIPSHSLIVLIRYCDKHAAASATKPIIEHNTIDCSTRGNTISSKETLDEWDQKLLGSLTTDTLFDLAKAVHFLDIQDLQNIICQKIADMMIGKNPQQLREMFNIANDLTEEVEEQIRKENAWPTLETTNSTLIGAIAALTSR